MTASPGKSGGAKPKPKPAKEPPRPQKAPKPEPEPAARATDFDRDDIIAAIRRVFSHVTLDGLSRNDAIREIAYDMGFERAGPRIKGDIDKALRAASQRGIVYSEGGVVYSDCRSIGQYDREALKRVLLSVMGGAWCNQDDAIVAAARHLGFLRTGPYIQQAFKSAIRGAIRQGMIERDGEYLRKA